MNKKIKYKVRFFFDYGCGGCLWPNSDKTYQDFDFGPIDDVIAEKTGKLSIESLEMIKAMDIIYSKYYNQHTPTDPSLWRQKDCDSFNKKVDELFARLTEELKEDFEIIDIQTRHIEDPELNEYLKDPINYNRKK
jgi:hypothetical protein